MATQPIGGESAAVIYPDRFPPAAAARIAFKLLNRHSPHEIAGAIEILMDVLDFMGGDPDQEDDDPAEATGDERDCATIEWHQAHPRQRQSGKAALIDTMGRYNACEDDEEDDAPGQYDEDYYTGPRPRSHWHGPGCTISDSDYGDADTGAV